jgi:HEPN domain-containing protein
LSPSPEQAEYASLLLRRAKGDLEACRVLVDNADIDDNIVGFHAQQAVEKALKVVLVLQGADLPLSHDLKFLVREVRESGVEPSDKLMDAQWLTPWAAELRYDEPVALDRPEALAVADNAVTWAESLLTGATSTKAQASGLSKTNPAEPDPTPATTGNPTLPDPL